ncbi:MAG: DMT family transporter [Coriobacteriia bacterium]|nr:DMT family transporter [Coriobacteriia bacterium]
MKYRLLIVLATVIWGSSFVIVKGVTDYLDPALLLAVRFLVAALVLAVVFAGRRSLYLRREYVGIGLLFGVALFAGYYLQTQGIRFTTPGKNAFLTGTYCVMVPFLAWLVTRNPPTVFNLVAAALCVGGVGLISLGNEAGVNVGDALTLACAVFYAIHIVLVARLSVGRNIYVLTMWQFAGAGACSLVVALLTGANFGQLAVLESGQVGALAYLALACTAFALLLQNVGQANLPPATASLLLSLESPFGVLFSVLAGAEVLQVKTVLGFCLVFAAIVVSEVLPGLRQKDALG